MIEGAGSPFLAEFTRTPSVPDGVYLHSGKSKEAARSGLDDLPPDIVDISDEARARLGQLHEILKGRGKRAGNGSDIQDNAFHRSITEFYDLLKGFQEIMEEVQEMSMDEDRIPPGFLRLLKQMTVFPRPEGETGINKLV